MSVTDRLYVINSWDAVLSQLCSPEFSGISQEEFEVWMAETKGYQKAIKEDVENARVTN